MLEFFEKYDLMKEKVKMRYSTKAAVYYRKML